MAVLEVQLAKEQSQCREAEERAKRERQRREEAERRASDLSQTNEEAERNLNTLILEKAGIASLHCYVIAHMLTLHLYSCDEGVRTTTV